MKLLLTSKPEWLTIQRSFERLLELPTAVAANWEIQSAMAELQAAIKDHKQEIALYECGELESLIRTGRSLKAA